MVSLIDNWFHSGLLNVLVVLMLLVNDGLSINGLCTDGLRKIKHLIRSFGFKPEIVFQRSYNDQAYFEFIHDFSILSSFGISTKSTTNLAISTTSIRTKTNRGSAYLPITSASVEDGLISKDIDLIRILANLTLPSIKRQGNTFVAIS